MPLPIPPYSNYPNPIVAIPAVWDANPKEGARTIPIEILWSTVPAYATNQRAVGINCAIAQAQTISQIAALDVDNTLCASDVQIIFPDGATTVLIPAYEKVIVPVYTQSTQFVVNAISVSASDVTRMTVLNNLPPPLSIPRSELANQAGGSGGYAIQAAAQQVVAATVNGTLSGLQVCCTVSGATGAWNASASLRDSQGNVLAGFGTAGATVGQTYLVFSASDMRVRFFGGIQLIQAGTLPTVGAYLISLYYRTP